ncbi:VOC family protein [Planococcus sp. 1R117A]|uniref:VOC family protein n=1 Tax=Planococcus sp. 1R117A TaxID=3447020 RepID=UPI003EDC2B64
MKGSITPYLTFYGQAGEASSFYEEVFGLERIGSQTYGDSGFPSPDHAKDYLLHCLLQKGDFRLMMADSVEEQPELPRSGLALVVECESEEEATTIFSKLSEGGQVIMELQDTFWGAKYGKVKDQYGFVWDLNVEKEK